MTQEESIKPLFFAVEILSKQAGPPLKSLGGSDLAVYDHFPHTTTKSAAVRAAWLVSAANWVAAVPPVPSGS